MRGLLVAVLVAAFVATVSTGHSHKRRYSRRRPAFNLERMSCDRIKRAGLCHCCKDTCDDVECLNNGVCVNGICNCPRGFSGADCGVDLCAAEPCKNNGTCVPEAGGVSCKCEDGFIGTYCETDACEPNPCQNCGRCMRIQGGFKCDCLGRITGRTCEVIDNIITSPNYPNNYPDDSPSSTNWTIPGCNGKQIRVVYDDNFGIDYQNITSGRPQCTPLGSGGCNDNHEITVFYYPTSISQSTFCGGRSPGTIELSSDVIAIYIRLVTNGNGAGCTGFKLTYTYLD